MLVISPRLPGRGPGGRRLAGRDIVARRRQPPRACRERHRRGGLRATVWALQGPLRFQLGGARRDADVDPHRVQRRRRPPARATRLRPRRLRRRRNALAFPFSARLHGRALQRSGGTGLVDVDIRAAMHGSASGTLEIQILGQPLGGGGVSMSRARFRRPRRRSRCSTGARSRRSTAPRSWRTSRTGRRVLTCGCAFPSTKRTAGVSGTVTGTGARRADARGEGNPAAARGWHPDRPMNLAEHHAIHGGASRLRAARGAGLMATSKSGSARPGRMRISNRGQDACGSRRQPATALGRRGERRRERAGERQGRVPARLRSPPGPGRLSAAAAAVNASAAIVCVKRRARAHGERSRPRSASARGLDRVPVESCDGPGRTTWPARRARSSTCSTRERPARSFTPPLPVRARGRRPADADSERRDAGTTGARRSPRRRVVPRPRARRRPGLHAGHDRAAPCDARRSMRSRRHAPRRADRDGRAARRPRRRRASSVATAGRGLKAEQGWTCRSPARCATRVTSGSGRDRPRARAGVRPPRDGDDRPLPRRPVGGSVRAVRIRPAGDRRRPRRDRGRRGRSPARSLGQMVGRPGPGPRRLSSPGRRRAHGREAPCRVFADDLDPA